MGLVFFVFFCALVTGPRRSLSLKLSDTQSVWVLNLSPHRKHCTVFERTRLYPSVARPLCGESDTKRVSILKTSGNEVYYTASSLLVISKNTCSKLHCQKFFKLRLFSYKIDTGHLRVVGEPSTLHPTPSSLYPTPYSLLTFFLNPLCGDAAIDSWVNSRFRP